MGVYIKGLSLNQLERNDGIIWGREGVKIPSDRVIEVPELHGKLVEFIDVVTYEEDGKVEVINFGEAYKAYCMMRAAKPVIEAEG